MISKIKNIFFSMSFTGTLLLIFALAVGLATFVERDFGTETAKALIYGSTWLEVLMFLLAINLIGNIFKYKMISQRKWGFFLFHFSFILIFVGAGLTRYIGFEGSMHIREGESSSVMNSLETLIHIDMDVEGKKETIEKTVFACPVSVEKFNPNLTLANKNISIKFIKYFAGGKEQIEEAETGVPTLSITTSDETLGRQDSYLMLNDAFKVGGVSFGFEYNTNTDIHFIKKEGKVFVMASDSLWRVDMQTREKRVIPADTLVPLELMQLYNFKGVHFVVKSYIPMAQKVMRSSSSAKAGETKDVIQYQVRVDKLVKDVFVYGGKGLFLPIQEELINGVHFRFRYGGKRMQLPFSIHLDDFKMERYPGSNSPASYESYVSLADKRNNIQMDYHIYMNHILNYEGYRFFQSSYDQDEKGTILSVNHDFWGTAVTYLGYFLMAFGMLASLLMRRGRFQLLARKFSKLREKSLLLSLPLMLIGTSVMAQQFSPEKIPQEQAANFSTLLVQSHDGRIKPMHTFCNELVRKITGSTGFQNQEPEQVILGMLVYPTEWQSVPMIKITHEGFKGLQDFLKTDQKYISYHQLIDSEGAYKLTNVVKKAYAKAPRYRNKFDKEVLKVDEVVNITYMIYQQSLFRLFPVRADSNNLWISPMRADEYLSKEEALFAKGILSMYSSELAQKNWEKANSYLTYIRDYQKKNSAKLYLSEQRIKMEILYNKININLKLMIWYGALGFLLLIIQFLALIIPRINIKLINRFAFALLSILFLAHTFGMGVRWYVAGHAPWSDSYESMIYISWASILAGLLFGRKSAFALSATSILSASLMSVAMMAWVNPEITNLVPVLKSYWLVLHVAIIISSYGFLGLGATLSLFNLLIINFKTDKNHLRLHSTVIELSVIVEMTLIVGLYLLSIGVFLGGIWANESWGRYWGWDSKETWSFVSMLIYAFVIHMRFIPGLKSIVAFNIASFFSFASILMTYFGVNFILTGLHSYASGDGFTIPSMAYFALYVFVILAGMAIYTESRYKKKQ